MFVDDDFLLPGLVLAGPQKGSNPISSVTTRNTASCRADHSAQPKTGHVHVQKLISKVHSGQGRSGTIKSSEARHVRSLAQHRNAHKESSKEPLPTLEQETMDDSDLDGAPLDGSLSPQSNTQPIVNAREQASLSSPAASTHFQSKDLARIPTLQHASDILYADTQVDIDMGMSTPLVAYAELPCLAQKSASLVHESAALEHEQAMDESPLQPTIEQDGPPEVVPSTQGAQAGQQMHLVVAPAEVAPALVTDIVVNEGECPRGGCDHSELAEAAQTTRASASTVEPPMPTQTLEMDATSDKKVTAPSEVVVVEDEASLAVAAQATLEALATVPADLHASMQTIACTTMSQAAAVGSGEVACSLRPPHRRMQIRRLGSHKRQKTKDHQAKLAPATKNDFRHVDVLLGDWVRNGGRSHTVKVVDASGSEPPLVEFQPSAGISLPIERAEGVWSLNGYALDEIGSTKNVLRWQHTISGATRLWWRPGTEVPADDLPSREMPSPQKPVHR